MNKDTAHSEALSIQKAKREEKKMSLHAQRMKHVRTVFANERGVDKLSQAKFAKMVGINPSTISHIEAGNTRIGIELAALIERQTGFRQAWLLTGDRPQRVSDAGGYAGAVPEKREDDNRGFPGPGRFHFTYVKKVKPNLSAGSGELVDEEETEDIYSFRTDWLLRKGPPSGMRLAQVSGDSMLPTLKDGDFVLFDTSKKDYVLDGKIMVIGIDNLLYIKRLRRIPEGTFLVSDNSAVYEPWRIDLASTRFLGLVIWHCGEV
jgi:phage repressor protein C with HTH and peptisase S24 domain